MALLTKERRLATVVASEQTKLYLLLRDDFYKFLRVSPLLKKAVEELMTKRGAELTAHSYVPKEVAKKWKEEVVTSLKTQDFAPTAAEIDEMVQVHGGASFGIWLGILLDGIPESLVIGLSFSENAGFPWAFIAGVFLANLPEAMSSSVVMQNQKYSKTRILLMWTSITIMTAIGAFVGNVFLQNMSVEAVAVLEGMAAGAMLTMIAETMMPEAFEQGGAVVGLSTLAGFLAALFVKFIS